MAVRPDENIVGAPACPGNPSGAHPDVERSGDEIFVEAVIGMYGPDATDDRATIAETGLIDRWSDPAPRARWPDACCTQINWSFTVTNYGDVKKTTTAKLT